MGTDKALLPLHGKTLLERAVEICKPVCKDILISSGNPEHSKLGYKIIPDETENCGPMGGIYSCLKLSKTDWNLVISVDSTFVETEFLAFLISQINRKTAVIPFHKNGKEPLISLYHKNCLPSIKSMIDKGDFKMHNLLVKINPQYVDAQKWIVKYPRLFHNLNRTQDLIN